ncbi:glycosyltransferase [Dysgonomonas macrotermitis]|uniref:Glycosyltransferase involved in cell wall bisynthesis n=1 Tax=Dysgonomonas macrotermitis TaxID=1346286 RepID=A0A1M5DT72_9BACT|nr:glycosyltransferase [Dysgonomonas macrotermitis]SHF70084.1 Glycosyltransferase involved in cell wall bisynthesis [Dysgonomonas macrotermitis]
MGIKVAQISVATTGGAGAAAYRLHTALNGNTAIDSYFVRQLPNPEYAFDKQVYTVDKKKYSYTDRLKAKLKIDIDTKNNQRAGIINLCNCEIASFPDTNFLIEDYPIVKEADIINLHWVAGFLNYPTFFKKINKPVVWTIHDMNPFSGVFHYEGDEFINHDIAGRLNQEALAEKLHSIHKSKKVYVVSPSEWLKKKSEESKILGIYPHFLIPNSLDFEQYPIMDRLHAKQTHNVDNGHKTLLFIAHDIQIHRKGFDLLIEALKNINSNNYNLISVGGQKVVVNDSINHIHYERIHDVRELNSIYSAADITILPSREDNLPNVMLESFANGTPVLSFRVGGMVEHVIPGKTGLLMPEINSGELTHYIQEFIANKFTFESSDIREYALQHFKGDRQAEAYSKLYNDILNQ